MKPHVPDNLPLKNIDWMQFIALVGTANAELARYDGILHGIINPQVLLSPLTTKEAVLSSKIEGTQATLEEVLEFEALPSIDESSEKYKDIQEIINYRTSVRFAVDWLEKKPITLNMIKKAHGILLHGVRGRDKARGRFRTSQNWIGKPGTPIEKASYVPPDPLKLMEYLSNLEKYIHFDEKDRLVQLAIIHAQFEIIHPFLDGNGRVGRILMPLFLYEKKLLDSPMFYISEYFESHRDEYYDRLKNISGKQKWEEWIEFFLKAVIEQSKINIQKAKSIISLYEAKKEKVFSITRSQYVIKILDALFNKPIFSSTDFIQETGIPKPSAMRYLNLLEKEGLLFTLREGSGRRAKILIFRKLIEIVK